MSLLRVSFIIFLLVSLLGVSFALNLPDRDLHSHGEGGNVYTQMGAGKEDGVHDHMPIEEFLEMTDHKHVTRKEDKTLENGEKAENVPADKSKDVIFNKLMENAGRSRMKPNKLQGPSLIARYVQGVRDAIGSDAGYASKKEEEMKKNEEIHKQMDFMTDFLDMEPLPIETEASDGSDSIEINVDQDLQNNTTDISHLDEKEDKTKDITFDQMDKEVNATELETQEIVLNLTETQDNHLDFMTNFLDDPMDMEVNSTEVNSTKTHGDSPLDIEAKVNATETFSPEFNATNNTLDIEVNATETVVNKTEPLENQLDFMTHFLDTDPIDTEVNITEEVKTTESHAQADATENKEIAKEEETTGGENQLDFVTNFLNADPFELMENPSIVHDKHENPTAVSDESIESLETEASDRSDSVDIDAGQEENLDFLTDFLSVSPAVLPNGESNDANKEENFELLTDLLNVDPSENEIPQDILDLYSEDEGKSDQDEVFKRKKPISSSVEFVNEDPNEEDTDEAADGFFWNWFGR